MRCRRRLRRWRSWRAPRCGSERLTLRTAWLVLLLGLAACGRNDGTPADRTTASAPASRAPASGSLPPGVSTFAIVSEQSKALYLADEEFFAGALKKLGITAGKRRVVGTTRAIDGQFQLDPSRPTAGLGNNKFTVRMNTFTTDQPRRDQYIRDDGPRFNDYPVATFTGTAIAASK